MNTASYPGETHTTVRCASPEIGSLLPDYIVDLLDDAAAEKVELHLVECPHCKERYLTVLRASREAPIVVGGTVASADEREATPVVLSDFHVQRKKQA